MFDSFPPLHPDRKRAVRTARLNTFFLSHCDYSLIKYQAYSSKKKNENIDILFIELMATRYGKRLFSKPAGFVFKKKWS